jgi:hypothetical protein
MGKLGKRFSLLFAVLILGVLLAFIPRIVSASQQTDSPLPDPCLFYIPVYGCSQIPQDVNDPQTKYYPEQVT